MSFDGHVENGQIVLDTPADLPDGAKVRVDLVLAEPEKTPESEQTFYERYKHLIGKAQHLPPDASVNHDHYLYGAPEAIAMKWLFADTSYYLAWLGPRDQHHAAAVEWSRRENLQIVTTEFVLAELGNFLTRGHDRTQFVDLNRTMRADSNTEIVPVSQGLFALALDLFAKRPDKNWSLTDCTSFVVMNERGLTDALTADQHFVQAGFRALLLEPATSA